VVGNLWAAALAAELADWPAFDNSLSELAGMVLRAGMGPAALDEISAAIASTARRQGQPQRAARIRAILAT